MSKLRTKWNLSLWYKGKNDPQIELDLRQVEKAYLGFAKQYAGRTDHLETEAELAKALAAYEHLAELAPAKPLMYFNYCHDLNSREVKTEAKLNLLSARYIKTANLTAFFPIALSQIASQLQTKYLASELLAPYRYFLKCLFVQGRHTLSEPEEKLINLKGLPARSLWIRGNEKLLGRQKVKWQKRFIPLTEAIELGPFLPTPQRRQLHQLISQQLKAISEFAENELTAIVLDKKIDDELRGFTQPYSATVLEYQNDLATVENLVATVSKNFKISRRFYKLKAKLLDLPFLTYADRAASIGQTKKKIPFDQAVEITSRAFAKVHPDYADILHDFLRHGQIDVFPKFGKTSGAYCSSYQELPIFVLLNHLPNFSAVRTLAHELGHALHSKFSTAHQPPFYRDYSTATAEVASTLFENFVFDEVFSLLPPAERIIALHDKISSAVQTIFRQIACFNFELELHQRIRAVGAMPKEEMAKLMNKHMLAYLGPIFKLQPADGYFFVYWSHLRRFFYVYSYAFGEIISNVLYSSYKQNHGFEKQIRQFLSAGGSVAPEDIFLKIGVDVRLPDFFAQGLKKIEADIILLENLIQT